MLYFINLSHSGSARVNNTRDHAAISWAAVTGTSLRTKARDSALKLLRFSGGLGVTSRSRWRSRRLLILCYHGFAQADEHLWDPQLYVSGDHFEARLRFLLDNHYAVLPLGEALARMNAGTLPDRAVAITVDDGAYDFRSIAYPILQRLGVPVTVYVATYHVFDRRPVFDVAFRYLIWKAMLSGPVMVDDPVDGTPTPIGSAEDYFRVTARIHRSVRLEGWSAERKHNWMQELAGKLDLDWEGFLNRRTLGLMHPEEIAQLDPGIADIQLHTHRHRVPEDRELFLREIRDNREALGKCGLDPAGRVHFCYPSGVHRPSFLSWLSEAGVVSAVTGTPGLASPNSHSLLLPRFIDASKTSEVEFEAWASGFRQLVHRPTRAFGIDA